MNTGCRVSGVVAPGEGPGGAKMAISGGGRGEGVRRVHTCAGGGLHLTLLRRNGHFGTLLGGTELRNVL